MPLPGGRGDDEGRGGAAEEAVEVRCAARDGLARLLSQPRRAGTWYSVASLSRISPHPNHA